MKRLFLLFLAAGSLAQGAVIEGDISAIDARGWTVTVAAGHGKTAVYRVRPDTEITVNGIRSKFPALAPKMTVKVTAADPTVASRIDATEAAAPPALAADGLPLSGPERRAAITGVKIVPGSIDEGGPNAPLIAELAESKWRLNDGRIITLHGNGTTEGTWIGAQGTWKVTGPQALEWTLSPKALQASKVALDKNIEHATWTDDHNQSVTAKKVPRPL